MASVSASPSASQEPPTTEMGTPSEPHSRSASGVPNPPRVRPTHTPKTPGDGTDEERHQAALVMAVNERPRSATIKHNVARRTVDDW